MASSPGLGRSHGTRVPLGEWPAQGQAAIVFGDGRAAVSPDEEPAPIASLAKVMTAYLTLERHPLGAGESGFTMTVSAAQAQAVAAEADEGQSVVAVRAGERLTERQLLEALLIPSGNNIARMLAVGVAGSEADFVEEMNDEADALGMDETTYTDPERVRSGDGLDRRRPAAGLPAGDALPGLPPDRLDAERRRCRWSARSPTSTR